jgi:hypothetical protein
LASARTPTDLFFLGLGLRQALNEIFHLFRLDHEVCDHLLLVRCYIPPLVFRRPLAWNYKKRGPSNTAGSSNFSGLRCLVIGMSGETCTKFDREVRYAIEFAMIVRSFHNFFFLGCRIELAGKKKIGKWG